MNWIRRKIRKEIQWEIFRFESLFAFWRKAYVNYRICVVYLSTHTKDWDKKKNTEETKITNAENGIKNMKPQEKERKSKEATVNLLETIERFKIIAQINNKTIPFVSYIVTIPFYAIVLLTGFFHYIYLCVCVCIMNMSVLFFSSLYFFFVIFIHSINKTFQIPLTLCSGVCCSKISKWFLAREENCWLIGIHQ